jgi:Tol biopolymer transport system component
MAKTLLACIGAALTLGAAAGSAASPLSFSRPATYPAGASPTAVAIGDLNGDGRLDLVAANVLGTSVSVLLNSGGGKFRPQGEYGTGSGPGSVAIGDLNGDGKPDVVTANDDADSVSVLLNRGGGRLGKRTDFRTGAGPGSVAIGDLNGDGKPDVATANFGDYTASVLINDGKGALRAKATYEVKQAWAIAVKDMNGDGRADLVVTSVTGLAVFLNHGDATFGPQLSQPTDTRSYTLAVGDLNGDGRPDVVTANVDGDAASVLISKGDGTFEAPRLYVTAAGAQSVAIADVNRDGKPDVVTAANRADSISVLLNKGDGTFLPKLDYRTGGGPEGIAVGDLNGDRKPDVVTTSASSTLAVLLNSTGARRATKRAAVRANGTIVFASNRTGNFEIYSIRADGSRLGQLTRNAAQDTRPSFSPNGRRVAFARENDLLVMNADGSRQHKLGRIEDQASPAWSPDSRRIAYEAAYVQSKDAFPLTTVGLDGRRRVVVPRGRNHDPSWSPDGKRIAFVREVGDRYDLMVVRADGAGLATLRRKVASYPAWSPNGDRIAILGGAKPGLFLLALDGRTVRRIPWGVTAFAWSADGRRIAFVAAGRLFVVRAAGGSPHDVTPDGVGNVSSAAWSPNGRWLVTVSVPLGVDTRDGDLFVVAADGSSSRKVAVGTAYPFGADNRSPSWRPHRATRARLGGAPVPLSPSESVSRVALRSVGPIFGLAADGSRVAVLVGSVESDCRHISVWAPGSRPVHLGIQEASCGSESEADAAVALAGTRVAWTESSFGNTEHHVVLQTATTARPAVASTTASVSSFIDDDSGAFVGAELGQLHGGGDLLVYNTWTDCWVKTRTCKAGELWHDKYNVTDEKLWRFAGSRPAAIRSGSGSFQATDVDAGRIVALEPGGSIDVVSSDGALVRRFVLQPGLARSAELSGSQVLVLTATGLQAFDTATGLQVATVPLAAAQRTPAGFEKGVAAYVEGRVVHVARLADGHQISFTLAGKGAVFAQLGAAGLFTAYTLGKGDHPGHVDFVSRAELERKLG